MKKILIIEDNAPLREEICDWFLFEGYEPCSAANGIEGIEMAMKHLPDLILCDIMMPEMDGNGVLEIIRSRPATRLIPFLFMTALSERGQVRAGMELGADDYITKPFTRDELLKAVRTRLKKSDDQQEHADAAMQELRKNLIVSLPHELRTPLNGILGFGQMFRDYPESFTMEELPEIGERIYNSGMRLYRLIQNYLLYAQLELKTGNETRHFRLENPGEVIERHAFTVATKYDRERDLEITLEPGTVLIPEIEFGKIVEELADNAFKFSNAKSRIFISCGSHDGSYRLIVEDLGRGISVEEIQKIGAFMQFGRDIHEQQGSGLGLAITKRIVKLFNGEMSIESTPGSGTKVTVILPGE
ncbi:MAG: hybrid sensor histidine kinase/response regulator [bacterium]